MQTMGNLSEKMGPYLSIDGKALSQGEQYTIITNKKAKGKNGALVKRRTRPVGLTIGKVEKKFQQVLLSVHNIGTKKTERPESGRECKNNKFTNKSDIANLVRQKFVSLCRIIKNRLQK